MQISVRPAAPEDVGVVLSDLSPRMERELPLLYPALDEAERRRLLVRQALGAILAGRASAFLAGGVPVCVLVWAEDGAQWSVATLATEAFYVPAFLRPARRQLDAVQRSLGAALVAHTRSDHARAGAWLRFLGFREEGEAGAPRYVRPAPGGGGRRAR